MWFICHAPKWLQWVKEVYDTILPDTIYTMVAILHCAMALVEAPLGDGFVRGGSWSVACIMAFNAVFIVVYLAESIIAWLLNM